MMLGFGIWYLGFGGKWIAAYHGSEEARQSTDHTRAIITGVQVLGYLKEILTNRLVSLLSRCS